MFYRHNLEDRYNKTKSMQNTKGARNGFSSSAAATRCEYVT